MDITTGREFSHTNPQDDPELYPKPPAGHYYTRDGTLKAHPINSPLKSSDKEPWWPCTKCTFQNPPGHMWCETCGIPRPGQISGALAK